MVLSSHESASELRESPLFRSGSHVLCLNLCGRSQGLGMRKGISSSRGLHSACSAVFAYTGFPLIPTSIPLSLLLLWSLCDRSVFVSTSESLFILLQNLTLREVTDHRGRIFVPAWNPPWSQGCSGSDV